MRLWCSSDTTGDGYRIIPFLIEVCIKMYTKFPSLICCQRWVTDAEVTTGVSFVTSPAALFGAQAS